MTSAESIVSEIVQRLPTLKRGSLSVYGDIFGGRMDNIHTVTGAHALGPSRVVIEFDERETFEVWDPQGATISEAEFKIRKAKSSPLGVVLLRPTTHSGEPLLH
jgi:hypothetical protein